jgi:hypothetical protein
LVDAAANFRSEPFLTLRSASADGSKVPGGDTLLRSPSSRCRSPRIFCQTIRAPEIEYVARAFPLLRRGRAALGRLPCPDDGRAAHLELSRHRRHRVALL